LARLAFDTALPGARNATSFRNTRHPRRGCPANNPPWVQVYQPAWGGESALPFPWSGVSPDRFTATVAARPIGG